MVYGLWQEVSNRKLDLFHSRLRVRGEGDWRWTHVSRSRCATWQVFFAVVLSATGVAQAAGIAPDMSSVQISVNSIFKILDRPSKIDPNAPGKMEKGAVRGKIEFKNVKFRYPTRQDVLVFQDLCLTVEIGQVWKTAKRLYTLV